MNVYFCDKYTHTDNEEEVERDMYAAFPFFGVLMIMMGMKSGKTNMKICSYISP